MVQPKTQNLIFLKFKSEHFVQSLLIHIFCRWQQLNQNGRRERLQMRVDSTVKEYIELKEKALEACDYQTALRALNLLAKHLKIFEHYRVASLLEAMENNPDNLEELVDQFLWINTSLGNWSYVLRALELKVKLAGKEKGEWDYEEMLGSLESAAWIWNIT